MAGLLRKWLARLPHPFSAADRDAGYRYDVPILQAAFALTQVLGRPLTGRLLFEEVIREKGGPGAPQPDADHLRLPGDQADAPRFRTRVITQGVTPSPYSDDNH